MQILKDGAIADGGLYVLIYWKFLLQRRLSDSIEDSVNKSFLYLVTQVFSKSSLHLVKIGKENVQGQLYRAYF